MHQFVALSGLAALVLALWAIQLTVLALHVRHSIHNSVRSPLSEDGEFALVVAIVIATLASATGGGSAIGAGLNATEWGWAHGILAVGASAAYLLLRYATAWDAKTWWEKRKTRKAAETTESAEATA